MAYAIGTTSGGGILMSDGSVVNKSSNTPMPGAEYPVGTTTRGGTLTNTGTSYNPPSSPGVILGLKSPEGGGGGGGGGGSSPGPFDKVWDPSLGMLVNRQDLEKRAAEERARQEAARNAIRSNINTTYDQYTQQLPTIQDYLTGQQSKDEGLIGETTGKITEGMAGALQAGKDKLAGTAEQVKTMGRQTASDVAQSLRNMLKASGIQFGAMGAGDSSATEVMAPYAYSKIGAQETSNVMRQQNDQLFQIKQKEHDLDQEYQSKLQEAEQWKTSQLMSIRDKFMPAILQIKQMMVNAPLQKMEALNNLEASIMTNAMQEAQAIETDMRQYAMNMASTAQNQLAQLTQLKLSLENNANFDPQQIVANQFPGMSVGGLQGAGAGSYLGPIKKNQQTD